MANEEVLNAIVKSMDVGFEDHGILTVFLTFEIPGGEHGFGLYNLGGSKSRHLSQKNVLGEFVQRVLHAVDVCSMSKAPGKCVRIRRKDRIIVAIGHIMHDDRWFSPSDELCQPEWKV